MKAESDPISDDEWLIRLVYMDRFTNRIPTISPNSFEPREGRHPDTDGISLFRKDCLSDAADALLVVAEAKRPLTGMVQIPVSLLTSLGLTVTSKRIDTVPGHVVIPQLNIADYKSDKAKYTPIKLRLAEVSSENILRNPSTIGGESK